MSRRKRDRVQPPIRLDSVVRDHMPPPEQELVLPVLPDQLDRLLGAFDAMGAWVNEFDGSGRLTWVSPGVERIIGFTPEEYRVSGPEFHPDDIPEIVRLGKVVRATGGPASNESRVRHKNGNWVWVDTTLLAWHASSDGEYHTIAIARDIGELKDAEAAKQESDARYDVVSNMSSDLICELDAEGRPVYFGPNLEEITGYTQEEALSLEPFELVHPDDQENTRERLSEAFADGESSQVDPPARGRALLELRIRHRDGHWIWFETMGLAYRRADGQLRYLAVNRDVSERKRAEQEWREFEESLQRAQKLESLGVLAGGIAHDFNNLLTPILGEAGLALSDLPGDSPIRERLSRIQRAAQRAAALTSQMLAYAGEQSLRAELLDLSSVVGDMLELAASSVSGRTSLDVRLEPDLPAIEAEAAQLGQVVMNLITNAAESLAGAPGHIGVRTGLVQIEAPPANLLFPEALGTGPHVYFEVQDTGEGMNAETRARMFEPFYTTKFAGRGLGLAAVAGIVRAHHGAIEVESEPSRGTRFRVLLPAVRGPITAPVRTPAAIANWRTHGTALVIDDDDGVRDLVEHTLRRAGMKVLTAADGHAGLKLFGLHADSIRVVVLDRTMPSLSGSDTLEALRAVAPDVRIILVSGYSEERVTDELAGRGVDAFLKKPFLPDTLLARVREALEAPADASGA